MSAVLPQPVRAAATPLRQKSYWIDRIAHVSIVVVAIVLIAFLALPLFAILVQALQGANVVRHAGDEGTLAAQVDGEHVSNIVRSDK